MLAAEAMSYQTKLTLQYSCAQRVISSRKANGGINYLFRRQRQRRAHLYRFTNDYAWRVPLQALYPAEI